MSIRKYPFMRLLAMYGCFATGVVYVSIGVIAVLSLLKLREGGADESSALMILNNSVAGSVLVWIVLTGSVSYVGWRLFEAIKDPYGYGQNVTGLAKRIGVAFSTLADILIVYSAARVVLRTGNIQANGVPHEERKLVEQFLLQAEGPAIIATVGIIVLLTAAAQLVYGLTSGYRERAHSNKFAGLTVNVLPVLGWIGYSGRAIILALIGFSYFQSGVRKNSDYVINTDKAFDFIGDHAGPAVFVMVATATICYGIFMFVLGLIYKTEKSN